MILTSAKPSLCESAEGEIHVAKLCALKFVAGNYCKLPAATLRAHSNETTDITPEVPQTVPIDTDNS